MKPVLRNVFSFTALAAIIILVTFGCKKDDPKNEITDGDGNVYETVTIGTQVWLTTNLKTTKYNDHTAIPIVTASDDWKSLSEPAYCWYNNDITNKDIYGGLYNWYALNTGKICPKGYHVPTKDEWSELKTILGNDAGGAMKITELWDTPNEGATNSSGFSALPGGMRADNDAATFLYMGEQSVFWCSTQSGPANADAYYIYADQTELYNYDYSKTLGSSIRCIKDK